MSEQAGNTNEIDLKDLMRAILDTRIWVIVALMVATATHWGYQIVTNFAKPTVHSYETRINLTFKGVQDGTYPNESPFSISDIIAPVVLNRVYDVNELNSFMDRQEFVSSFSIAPYTPDREFILEKYADKLNSRNLSTAEIDALQQQLKDELRNEATDSVAITFSSSKADKIPRQLMTKVLRDVPAEWVRHMIDDVGVMRFDDEIYTDKVVDMNLFESADYLIAFELLLDRVLLLEDNIDKIKEIPNGLVVVDDDSGYSLPDLERAVIDTRRYRIAPLMNPVRSLGIAKSPELVKLYFENELIVLERKRNILEQKKNNIDEAYSSYIKYESRRSGGQDAGGNVGSGSMIPQFGAEFLDRIIEMTHAGADIEYRQELNTKLLEISDRLADASGEVTRIQDILKSLNSSSGNTATQELRENYAERVKEELPALIQQLKVYFQVSNRLYAKLSRQDLGNRGSMYKTADGDIVYSESRAVVNASNLRLYLIICFLVVVVVVPVAMIRNAMRA